MNIRIPTFSEYKCVLLVLFLSLACAVANADAGDEECQASGEYSFVCGPQNAEDLVLVPATSWIISSGMAPGAAIYLIDSQQKTWTDLYPADTPHARQNMETFGACPGSPDPGNFYTHGLNLRPGENGHSTLLEKSSMSCRLGCLLSLPTRIAIRRGHCEAQNAWRSFPIIFTWEVMEI